jgi:hypothetical protein
MNTNTHPGKHSFSVASCVFFAGFLVIAGILFDKKYVHDNGMSQAAAQIETIPMRQSLARGFPITNIVGTREQGYQVTLRNDYDKSIVAFELGAGRGRMTRDLIHKNETIKPGASHTEYYGYEPVLDTKPLTLFGVVFEDGSGAGESDSVKAIKDMRLGAKMRLAQFAPILEGALESAKAGSPRVLDRLLSKTNALTADAVDGLPSNVKFGFHNEKQRLLSEIQQIKSMGEGGVSVPQETENQVVTRLLKLESNNEARNMRLANRQIQ